MGLERHVRLFRSGRHKALRIPLEFEFEGDEAVIRKEGDRLVLVPVAPKNRLIELLETLEPIEEEFPEVEDPPVKDLRVENWLPE